MKVRQAHWAPYGAGSIAVHGGVDVLSRDHSEPDGDVDLYPVVSELRSWLTVAIAFTVGVWLQLGIWTLVAVTAMALRQTPAG